MVIASLRAGWKFLAIQEGTTPGLDRWSILQSWEFKYGIVGGAASSGLGDQWGRAPVRRDAPPGLILQAGARSQPGIPLTAGRTQPAGTTESRGTSRSTRSSEFPPSSRSL